MRIHVIGWGRAGKRWGAIAESRGHSVTHSDLKESPRAANRYIVATPPDSGRWTTFTFDQPTLYEKPGDLNLFESRPYHLMVANMRFHPQARHLWDDPNYPLFASFSYSYALPRQRPDWQTGYARKLGCALDSAWHATDLALRHYGKAKVLASWKVVPPGEPAEWAFGMILSHESGVMSRIVVDWLGHDREQYIGLQYIDHRERYLLERDDRMYEDLFDEWMLDPETVRLPTVTEGLATTRLIIEARDRAACHTIRDFSKVLSHWTVPAAS